MRAPASAAVNTASLGPASPAGLSTKPGVPASEQDLLAAYLHLRAKDLANAWPTRARTPRKSTTRFAGAKPRSLAKLRSGDEASFVPGNHRPELPDLLAEPGFDHCRPPADHERLVGTPARGFPDLHLAVVLDEARAGDPLPAGQRLRVLQSLPLLDITPEVAELTSGILASGKIPRKAATDAAHIAIAAVHGMDFLLTWNCAHIANAATVKAIASICREHGCECPVICTPEELLGE
jgi:hypothetical protein